MITFKIPFTLMEFSHNTIPDKVVMVMVVV